MTYFIMQRLSIHFLLILHANEVFLGPLRSCSRLVQFLNRVTLESFEVSESNIGQVDLKQIIRGRNEVNNRANEGKLSVATMK